MVLVFDKKISRGKDAVIMRLNQFLARSLGVARRQGDELIKKERVRVNGQVGQLFSQVGETDLVEVRQDQGWQRIGFPSRSQTILFYKPIFCVTTRQDPEKRKTVYDFLPPTYHQLKPAGRLDYLSEGLLVLSSDGALLQKLTHPKFGGSKLYLVGLSGRLQESQIRQMSMGLELEGYRLNPMRVFQDSKRLQEFAYLKLDPKSQWYFFELTEGRNQQIRKLCRKFGQKVHRLVRLQQGEFMVSRELYEQRYIAVNSE